MVESEMVRAEVKLLQEILLKNEVNMEASAQFKMLCGKIRVMGKAGWGHLEIRKARQG